MREERMRILKLVEEGTISAEEASRLLRALEETPRGKRPKWLKVRVYRDEEPKVSVNLPVSLLKLGAKIGGKLAISLPEKAQQKLKEKGIDPSNLETLGKIEELLDELVGEGPFKLVDVDEGDEKVEVYLE